MLDVQNLTAFLTVVERGSFSAAAESLGISQPRMSLLIQRLEDRLGFKLFFRTTRSLKLSREGAVFLNRARELLALHKEVLGVARDLRNSSQKRVSIGSPPQSADIPARESLLEAFIGRFKDIKVDIYNLADDNLIDGLQNSEVDLALSFLDSDSLSGVESIEISRATLCIGHPPHHYLGSESPIPLSRVHGVDLAVLPREQLNTMFNERFDRVERAGAHFIEAPEAAVSTLLKFGQLRALPLLLFRWPEQIGEGPLDWTPLEGGISVSLKLFRRIDRALRPSAETFWNTAAAMVRQPAIHG